jgi:hypothetical protein
MSNRRARRELSVITDEIKVILKRSTADIIKLGGLLVEAKKQVEHGEWLPWLAREFSISERSAQRYIKVFKFAAKHDTVADLNNISPSALYMLIEEDFAPLARHCVDLSRTKRVGTQDVWSSAGYLNGHLLKPQKETREDFRPPRPTAAENKAAHERWVKEGKPAFDAEQEAERKRAAQHAAKIALSRFKEGCDTWLPRMTPEERKESLRYLTEIVAQQELSFAPASIEHQPEKSPTLPSKVAVNGQPIDLGKLGPAAQQQIASAMASTAEVAA